MSDETPTTATPLPDRRFGKREKPWTRNPRQPADGTLPRRWEPRFLDGMDSRLGIVQKLRQRITDLNAEVQADSILKQMLVDRFCFMQTALETLESAALLEGKFDPGAWTQMVNAATGIIRALGGVEKKARPVGNLRQYIDREAAG